jgi:hypothetical protein
MRCSTSPEAQKALRIHVAKEMLDLVDGGKTLDIKVLVRGVYDMINNATEDHVQALDYARFVPYMVDHLQSSDSRLKKLMLDSNVDYTALSSLILDTIEGEEGLAKMNTYLDLKDTSVKKSLKVINGGGSQTSIDFPEPQTKAEMKAERDLLLEELEKQKAEGLSLKEYKNLKRKIKTDYKAKLASLNKKKVQEEEDEESFEPGDVVFYVNPKTGETYKSRVVEIRPNGRVLLENKKSVSRKNITAAATEQDVNSNFKGKLIYATPGAGKTTAAKDNPDVIDTDEIMVDEIAKTGFRPIAEGESTSDYIFDFAKKGVISKDELNGRVLDVIGSLLSEGKTVLTGTYKFIELAHVIIQAENDDVYARFGGKENFERWRDAKENPGVAKSNSPLKGKMKTRHFDGSLYVTKVVEEDEEIYTEEDLYHLAAEAEKIKAELEGIKILKNATELGAEPIEEFVINNWAPVNIREAQKETVGDRRKGQGKDIHVSLANSTTDLTVRQLIHDIYTSWTDERGGRPEDIDSIQEIVHDILLAGSLKQYKEAYSDYKYGVNELKDQLKEINKILNRYGKVADPKPKGVEDQAPPSYKKPVISLNRKNPLTLSGQAIRDQIEGSWQAMMPTFFGDHTGEVGSFVERMPLADRQFYYGVKRTLLEAMRDQGTSGDSTKLTLNDITEGVFLTGMSINDLPGNEYLNKVKQKDPNAVVMVLTNSFGQPLQFNSKYEHVIEGGKPAYYTLKDPTPIINTEGNVTNERTLSMMASSLAKSMKIPVSQALAQVKKEALAVHDVRTYINSQRSSEKGADSKTTQEDLESAGFSFARMWEGDISAYYEGHPDYKITINKKQGKYVVAETPWKKEQAANTGRVPSGGAVDVLNGTLYEFSTIEEAHAKALELSNFQSEVGTGVSLQFKINGGSLGYIKLESRTPTKLSDVTENLTYEVSEEESAGIKMGATYITSPGLYGAQLELERPGIEQSGNLELTIDLLTESLFNNKGEPMLYSERRELIRNYVDLAPNEEEAASDDNKRFILVKKVEGDPQGYTLFIRSKAQNLTTPQGVAAAKAELRSLFTSKKRDARNQENAGGEFVKKLPVGATLAQSVDTANMDDYVRTQDGNGYRRVIYDFKMNIVKELVEEVGKTVKVPSIETAANGRKTVSITEVPYHSFLKQSDFRVNSPELSKDGKFRRVNAYFTFELSEEGIQDLYEEATDTVTVESEKKIVEVRKTTAAKRITTEQNNVDLGLDDKNPLFTNMKQKARSKQAIKAQRDAAEEWYNGHPMQEWIPFKEMFHIANRQGVAEWTVQGITLYKGSDHTDLYHEAWHGFTQTFMTPVQRKALYKELHNKTGSFKDYNNNLQTFRHATDKQLEEYLAEEFRSYMLNGQKGKKGTPKQNNFFRRLWNALKALFSKSSRRDTLLDPLGDAAIYNIFEKLKLGEISEYSFNSDNVQFGTLNQGISARELTEGETVEELNYQNSQEITEMIDGYIADYINVKNSKLNPVEADRLTYIKGQLSKKNLPLNTITKNGKTIEGRVELTAERDALESRKTYVWTGRITKDPAMLLQAYIYAKNSIGQLINAKIDQLEDPATEPSDIAGLEKDIETLSFVHNHFGDTTSLEANTPESGEKIYDVMAYHMVKTSLFTDAEVRLEGEDQSEEERQKQALRGFERNGNETSLKDLVKAEISYLLKILPDVQKDGSVRTNRFGVPALADFQTTWVKIVRATENVQTIDKLYEALQELKAEYPPVGVLLDRMADPTSENIETAEDALWTNFFQAFTNPRVSLIQFTVTMNEYDEDGNQTPTEWDSTVGEAFGADKAVGRGWQFAFTRAQPGTSEYILRDKEGNFLNTPLLLKNFPWAKVKEDPFEFYKALGFTMTDTPAIRKALRTNRSKYSPKYFYDVLLELNKTGGRIENYTDIIEGSPTKYNNLQKLEAKNADIFSSFMVTNAEGNTQFEHTLNNSLSMMIMGINNAKDYQDLVSKPQFEHLNVKTNPFTENSIWMKSMFHLEESDHALGIYGNRRKHKGEEITLKFVNLSGAHLKEKGDDYGVGTASASADKYSKAILDFHLGHSGYFEFMRHADKGTSFAVTLTGPAIGNKDSNDLYVPLKHFKDGEQYKNTTVDRLVPHIVAEMSRIRIMKELWEKRDEISDYDFEYIENGRSFTSFDDVLTESKDILMSMVDSDMSPEDFAAAIDENPKLMSLLKDEITSYFEAEYEINYKTFLEAPFIADNVKVDLNRNGITGKAVSETLVRSHTINAWIHNIESIAMLYGDLAQYNHAKEAFHKRNAGAGSTGTIYRTDIHKQNVINNKLYASSYTAQNAERLGIEEQHMYTGRMNTAIMEDMSVSSVYMKEYEAAIGDKVDGYKGQNEGDGQGLISFDAYRQLKVAEGSWSEDHEMLFRDIVNGKDVQDKDVHKFFPVLKAQYWGPLKTNFLPVTAFHKYSLFPMIPSVIKGTKMEALHDKMTQENISYVTFESGSKVGIVTKSYNMNDDGQLTREYDKVYEDQLTRDLDAGLSIDNKERHFTPNVIHLEYLKNQLEIHDERKGKVIFSTQLRKLVEDGLMTNGVPSDFMKGESAKDRIDAWKNTVDKEGASKFYSLVKVYEANLDKLTSWQKNKLLEEIEWKAEMIDGEEILTGNMSNLIALVDKELRRQDVAEHALNFLKVDENGRFRDLSLSLSTEQIEKLLNALMVKRLIKQKVNGEGLIQVAASLMEDMNAAEGRDFHNPTENDLAKYGTNDLPFYRQNKMPDIVKISMQGDNKKRILGGTKTTTIRSAAQAKTLGIAAGETAVIEVDGVYFRITNRGEQTIEEAGGKDAMVKSEGLKSEDDFKYAQTKKWVNGAGKLFVYDIEYDQATNTLDATGGEKTSAMKVKVSLTGDFLKLLKGVHTDGKKIKTRARLNAMIKSEEWLNTGDNRKMVTMVGVRIPVQGLNSMEFMEVYQFLPAAAGSIIVPPTEIVTKSGADFDVDKMTVMMPNLDVIGGATELVKSTEPTADKATLTAEKKEVQSELEAIDELYDAQFEERDQEGAFAFTEEERAVIQSKKDEVLAVQEEIQKYVDQRKVLVGKPTTAGIKKKIAKVDEILSALKTTKFDLHQEKFALVKAAEKDKARALGQEKNSKKAPLLQRLAELQREINGHSKKGIENDLISNIAEILALPENFKPLITPNSTDLLDEAAAELKDAAMDVNPLDNVNGERRTKLIRGKEKEVISPTRVLEMGYNMYKHESNAVGKEALGLGAVDNTYNTLFNRIGAHMNPTNTNPQEYKIAKAAEIKYTKENDVYKKAYIVWSRLSVKEKAKTIAPTPPVKLSKEIKKILDNYQKQTLLLNHNKMTVGSQEAISLSNTHDAAKDGNSIADVINQLINGWVDVAADAWIFNIQGNKEIAPTLLFMAQAGVPIKEAIYFVSNPLIREYVKQQKLAKSTFSLALGTAPVDQDGNHQPDWFRSAAKNKILENPDFGFNGGKAKDLRKKYLPKTKFDVSKLRTAAMTKLEDRTINDMDRGVFIHFLQIEEMGKSVAALKMKTNVDTSRDGSLFEAQDRLYDIEALEQDARIPSSMVKRIQSESPIASFFIQEFQIKLLGDMFPLRNHTLVNEFIKNTMDKTIIETTYGDKEKAVQSWKSDLVSYMFQNELRYIDAENMTTYKGMDIEMPAEDIILEHGAYVSEGVIYVDRAALKLQYYGQGADESTAKEFSKPDYWNNYKLSKVPAEAFPTFEDYFKFVLEREVQRSRRPLSSLWNSKKFEHIQTYVREFIEQRENEDSTTYDKRIALISYEKYLAGIALNKSFNHWQLFKSYDTAAHEFVRINEEYPKLANHFRLMTALDFRPSAATGYKNLAMNDTQMDGDQLNVLHENVLDLQSEAKIREIMPDATDQDILEITEYFASFPIVAFLQSGFAAKSSFALTNFVPQDQVLGVLEEPLEAFMKALDNNDPIATNYLDGFNSLWRKANSRASRATRVRGKNFNQQVSYTDTDSISVKQIRRYRPTFFVSNPTSSEDRMSMEEGKTIISQDDISKYNSYMAKTKKKPIYFFTGSSVFAEFYNNDTGKRGPAPQSSKWILDPSTGLYNLIDKETGEEYISNVDLKTGKQIIVTLEQSTEDVQVISPDYGVVQVETNPTEKDVEEDVKLIRDQIAKQSFKENLGKAANWMFHYGLRWGRIKGNPKAGIAPMTSPISNDPADGGNYFGYDRYDQNGELLTGLSPLQPIIDKIEQSLGLDMSDYDSVIGNIYLPGEYIYPHKDTTESRSARNYPVIVYTIGNDAGLGIVDNNEGEVTFHNQYDTTYLSNEEKLKGYTNELRTKSGSIYTFGLDGKGRFELTHSTPTNTSKPVAQPPITLSDGRVVTDYTITLTFRRAQKVTQTTGSLSLENSKVKKQPHWNKDNEMAGWSTKAIAFDVTKLAPKIIKPGYVSSTGAYLDAIGGSSTEFDQTDSVWIFGAGKWNFARKGQEALDKLFEKRYKPMIDKAISQGVTTFNIGKASGIDSMATAYLKEQGFKVEPWIVADSIGQWNVVSIKQTTPRPIARHIVPAAPKKLGSIVNSFTPGKYLTFNAGTVEGPSSAKVRLEKHPDKAFIYNKGILSSTGPKKSDQFLHGQGSNTIGLPTLRHYTTPQKDANTERGEVLKDINGNIHPKVKEHIDIAIREMQNTSKQLVFSTGGYGQEMLEKSKSGEQFGLQTFLYLSEQLYEKFGYLNPGYLKQDQGRTRVQKNQPITDEMVREAKDDAVEDFIKKCRLG